jgi:hypothetical protein
MQTKRNNLQKNGFNKSLVLFIMSVFIFSSCAKIFYSPDAYQLADRQKTIAIVPPSVSIAAQRKVDAESIKEQQRTESINFQKEIYSWMLKRKMQGSIVQEIQEPETTNSKLKNAGYPEKAFTSQEMCEILGVDGVLSANFNLSKPMSDGGAVALYVLTGGYGSTNEIHVSLSIHDTSKNKLIWNYDHKFAGGIGSSTANLVDAMMRQASRKMPYVRVY